MHKYGTGSQLEGGWLVPSANIAKSLETFSDYYNLKGTIAI